MFFNPDFMNNYITTIGSTVYYPTEQFTKLKQVSSSIILLHELVHIYDSNKTTKPLFMFLYLIPQIFILLALPLFIISWKIALPLIILFALPLPAYFRMYFEKRAYMASLYVMEKLSKKLNFNSILLDQETFFLTQFKNSSYYFMWPFSNLQAEFDNSVKEINNGNRPYNDEVFDIIDVLVEKV